MGIIPQQFPFPGQVLGGSRSLKGKRKIKTNQTITQPESWIFALFLFFVVVCGKRKRKPTKPYSTRIVEFPLFCCFFFPRNRRNFGNIGMLPGWKRRRRSREKGAAIEVGLTKMQEWGWKLEIPLSLSLSTPPKIPEFWNVPDENVRRRRQRGVAESFLFAVVVFSVFFSLCVLVPKKFQN